MLSPTVSGPERHRGGAPDGASVKAVHQEVSRLVESGLLADRKVGTARLVRSVRDSLLTRPLTDLGHFPS